jgi:hypothetical protein
MDADMSMFAIILGSAVMLWALFTGEIGIYGGGVTRKDNPFLFWAAFLLCSAIVILFACLEVFVPDF